MREIQALFAPNCGCDVRAGRSGVLLGVCLAMVALMLGGCSSDTPANMVDTPAVDLSQIARAYNANVSPPKDLAELTASLAEFAEAGMMAEPEQLLRSARDGEAYVIVFSPPANTAPAAIVAYERRGADGTRYVLRREGRVEEISNAQFARGPFPPGHVVE